MFGICRRSDLIWKPVGRYQGSRWRISFISRIYRGGFVSLSIVAIRHVHYYCFWEWCQRRTDGFLPPQFSFSTLTFINFYQCGIFHRCGNTEDRQQSHQKICTVFRWHADVWDCRSSTEEQHIQKQQISWKTNDLLGVDRIIIKMATPPSFYTHSGSINKAELWRGWVNKHAMNSSINIKSRW